MKLYVTAQDMEAIVENLAGDREQLRASAEKFFSDGWGVKAAALFEDEIGEVRFFFSDGSYIDGQLPRDIAKRSGFFDDDHRIFAVNCYFSDRHFTDDDGFVREEALLLAWEEAKFPKHWCRMTEEEWKVSPSRYIGEGGVRYIVKLTDQGTMLIPVQFV